MKHSEAVEVLERIVARFLGPEDQPEEVRDNDHDAAYEAISAIKAKAELNPAHLYVGTVAVFARSGGWVSHRDDGVYAEHQVNGAVAVAVGGGAHSNRALAVEALRTLNQEGPQGLMTPRFPDHVVAQTVNRVTEVAVEFAGHQSLRERIAQILRGVLK